MGKVLVWDRHTRLFHWLLVLLFSFSIGSGLYNDMDVMEWHMLSGYGLLALLLFRLLTGVAGRDYGHFRRLSLSPASILAYLRGDRQFQGHNPLGSWMVVVMLALLLTQVLSGLMTSDDIFVEGPWVVWVDEQWVSLAGTVHSLNYYALIGLVVTHILAIGYYQLIKKQNLLAPMVSGMALQKAGQQGQAQPISVVRLLLIAAIAGGLSWFAITFS